MILIVPYSMKPKIYKYDKYLVKHISWKIIRREKYFYVKYEDNQLATDTWQTIFAVEIFTSKMKVVLILLSFALKHGV